jgi:hypothetical protein
MHHLERIVQDGDEAFVLYDCETVSGDRFRNTERLMFEGGKLKAVEVYFGDPPIGLSKLTSSEAALQAKVRALIEKRVAAVRAKDVDGAVEGVSADMVMFDVVEPLQREAPRASGNARRPGFRPSRARSATKCATSSSLPAATSRSHTASTATAAQ